jgi:hypothetical protein
VAEGHLDYVSRGRRGELPSLLKTLTRLQVREEGGEENALLMTLIQQWWRGKRIEGGGKGEWGCLLLMFAFVVFNVSRVCLVKHWCSVIVVLRYCNVYFI